MATNKVYKLSSDKLLADSIVYKDGNSFYPITKLIPTLLYSSNGSNATVTLNDSSANYEYLEILYKTNDNDHKSAKIYSPNGKNVLLDASATSGNYIYIKSAHYTINTNKINLNSSYYSQARIGNNVATTFNKESNRIYIERVLGYK